MIIRSAYVVVLKVHDHKRRQAIETEQRRYLPLGGGRSLIVDGDDVSQWFDEYLALGSDDQVVAVLQQVDGMRAAGYGRTGILRSQVTVLNATSAVYEGAISRRRSDGDEINRFTATYLVTDWSAGRRISVLAVHSPRSGGRSERDQTAS